MLTSWFQRGVFITKMDKRNYITTCSTVYAAHPCARLAKLKAPMHTWLDTLDTLFVLLVERLKSTDQKISSITIELLLKNTRERKTGRGGGISEREREKGRERLRKRARERGMKGGAEEGREGRGEGGRERESEGDTNKTRVYVCVCVGGVTSSESCAFAPRVHAS